MSTKALIGLGLLAFALLCFLCISYHGPSFLAATTPSVANLAAPTFTARLFDGKVTLSGTLPDQAAKDKVLAEARRVYGEGKFIDNLQISNRTGFPNAAWLPAALALLPLTQQTNNEGGFTLDGGSVTVRGLVEGDDVKTKLIADATKAATPLTLIDKVLVKGKVTAAQSADFQAQFNQAIAGKIVEFEVGKDVITPTGQAVLEQMVAVFAQIPGIPVEVGGHTDSRGAAKQNLNLSQRRAEACLKYLTEHGVAANRLTAKGYGSTKLVAKEDTPEGLQRNRRTEFTVLKEAK